MKVRLLKFVTYFAIGLFLSPTVGAMEKGAKIAGAIAYSCDLSPAQLMAVAASRVIKDDPAAEINFKFNATIVKDNNVLIKSMEGLPGHAPQANSSMNSAIVIPFSVSDYRVDGSVDSEAFESYVSDQLSRLQVRESTNGLNCGGSPPGTVIAEFVNSCLLGNVRTEYIGRVHPVTGDEEWIVKSSKFGLSDNAECNPHITKR